MFYLKVGLLIHPEFDVRKSKNKSKVDWGYFRIWFIFLWIYYIECIYIYLHLVGFDLHLNMNEFKGGKIHVSVLIHRSRDANKRYWLISNALRAASNTPTCYFLIYLFHKTNSMKTLWLLNWLHNMHVVVKLTV